MKSPTGAEVARRKMTPLPDFIPPQLCTSLDRSESQGA
jgi:hypothetical protein